MATFPHVGSIELGKYPPHLDSPKHPARCLRDIRKLRENGQKNVTALRTPLGDCAQRVLRQEGYESWSKGLVDLFEEKKNLEDPGPFLPGLPVPQGAGRGAVEAAVQLRGGIVAVGRPEARGHARGCGVKALIQ